MGSVYDGLYISKGSKSHWNEYPLLMIEVKAASLWCAVMTILEDIISMSVVYLYNYVYFRAGRL